MECVRERVRNSWCEGRRMNLVEVHSPRRGYSEIWGRCLQIHNWPLASSEDDGSDESEEKNECWGKGVVWKSVGISWYFPGITYALANIYLSPALCAAVWNTHTKSPLSHSHTQRLLVQSSSSSQCAEEKRGKHVKSLSFSVWPYSFSHTSEKIGKGERKKNCKKRHDDDLSIEVHGWHGMYAGTTGRP